MFAEVSGRTRKHDSGEIGKLSVELGIGESRIDLGVETIAAGVFFGAPMPVQKLNS